MEEALKRELGTAVLRATGHLGGGCISQGQSYETDSGRVYVKSNSKPEVGRVLRVGCVWRDPGSCAGIMRAPVRAAAPWRWARLGSASL
uniref:Uncharacterized protein n=1 Tax=Pavo cristatus TaxID=9049 RepID=A0A8C9FDJ5_PAVCR